MAGGAPGLDRDPKGAESRRFADGSGRGRGIRHSFSRIGGRSPSAIDESSGRLEASRRGIPNTGTLGVLRAAAIEHLVDLPSALDRLLATNFRVSKGLVGDLLAEDLQRKQRGH